MTAPPEGWCNFDSECVQSGNRKVATFGAGYTVKRLMKRNVLFAG